MKEPLLTEFPHGPARPVGRKKTFQEHLQRIAQQTTTDANKLRGRPGESGGVEQTKEQS